MISVNSIFQILSFVVKTYFPHIEPIIYLYGRLHDPCMTHGTDGRRRGRAQLFGAPPWATPNKSSQIRADNGSAALQSPGLKTLIFKGF